MTKTPLTYIDTNILISYALGEEKDTRFHIAKRVFEDVLQGKCIVVISHFVLSEALYALRNIATKEVFKEIENTPSQRDLINIANSSEFRKKVNDRSLAAFKKIVESITSNPDHFRINAPETPYSEEIFSKGLRILSQNLGIFRVFRYRCRKCESYMKCGNCGINSAIVYKSVNAPDVTHALISDSIQCDYFFTMDKGFGNIPQEDFKTKIIVLSEK